MMNLDIELKNILKKIDTNNKPNLFLHVCCCPCSSHIILKLINYFNLFIVFYNPNIDTKEEFSKRLTELKKFINNVSKENAALNSIKIIYENYIHNEFLDYISGFENEPERGKRCELCVKLRLEKTLDIVKNYIKNNNIKLDKKNNEIYENYFCTSLSTSPYKNAQLIYEIGKNLSNDNLEYLPSDFKKANGYLDSINLSKKYNIYRQNYCGCEFSK